VVLLGSVPLSLAAQLLRGSSWGTSAPMLGVTHSLAWIEIQPEAGVTWKEVEDQYHRDVGDE